MPFAQGGVDVGFAVVGSAMTTLPVIPTRRGVLDSIVISTRLSPFSCHFFVIVPPTWMVSPARWNSVIRKLADRTRP